MNEKEMKGFVSMFADGTPLTADVLAKARDSGLIFLNGGEWSLTEFGANMIGRTVAHRESDPTGRSQHETGAKLDAGKPRMGLVLGAFGKALTEVAKVGTYGAQKYTDNGWIDVPKGQARYTDALLRHIFAEADESHDSDTGLLHAAHAAWNALARLELMLRKRGVTE